MGSAGIAAGGLMILLGFGMLFYPGLIPGFTAQNNCPLNEGVNVNVSPSTVAPNGALALSGGVFPASGSCTLAGSTVYFGIVSGAQGSAQSSVNNGQWSSGVLAPGTPGTYTVLASLCAYPHTSCNVCTEPSGACIDGSASFTVSNNPPPTYSVTAYFSDSATGNPISGVFVVVSQGSTTFGTCTSVSGQCTVANLVNGNYLLSYQPSSGAGGIYNPGSKSFSISGASINLNIPLQNFLTTSTTTVVSTTTAVTTITTIVPSTTFTSYTTVTGTGGTSTGTCISAGVLTSPVLIPSQSSVTFSFTLPYASTLTGTFTVTGQSGLPNIVNLALGPGGGGSIVTQTGISSYTFNQNLPAGSYVLTISNIVANQNTLTVSGNVQLSGCSTNGSGSFGFTQLIPYGLIFGGALVIAGSSGGRSSGSRRRS